MATVNWSLQHFTDTAANFTANNPTLLAGQLGIETDGLTTTPKFKIGDGTSTWTALPYFYGGSASAQDLNNVLTVGNTTSGQDIVLTDDDKLQIGSTAGRYISYDTNLIQIGLGIVNTNSNDHIVLQDGGGIHVDTTFLELPHLTASRVIATDANNRLSALTGTGFLTLNAGVISYDTNTYQPLDSDLTSWAGVTRASGFDTFVATPSSANLSSLLTDKTGTGVNVFGTSPTFTTDITTPLIIGGSAVGSTIQYKGTSGNGTSTVAAHQFLVGNNGATTAASIYNSGQVNIGNYASPTNLRALTVGQDTAYCSIGSLVGATSFVAFYANQGTPSSTNYLITSSGSESYLNSSDSVGLRWQNSNRYLISNSGLTHLFTTSTTSSGAITNFTFTCGANTGQTASTEITNFKVTGATKTWAAGAITTQRWNYFTANTAAFASASTITNSYGLYVEAATAGTNATITNNWGIGTTGDINIISSSAALYLGDLTPSSTNYALKYTAASEISLNAPTTLRFRCGGTLFATGSSTDLTINGTAGLSIANNANDTKITLSRTTGNTHSIQLTTTDYYLYNNTAAAIRYGVTNAGNFYIGAKSALATTATDGFLYVPSCAGAPTGVPTAITGKIPIVADSTNNKLYIYSGGAWVALN